MARALGSGHTSASVVTDKQHVTNPNPKPHLPKFNLNQSSQIYSLYLFPKFPKNSPITFVVHICLSLPLFSVNKRFLNWVILPTNKTNRQHESKHFYIIATKIGSFCRIELYHKGRRTLVCQVQNSLCAQVLPSPILAALLHRTPAAGVSQTLRRGLYKE